MLSFLIDNVFPFLGNIFAALVDFSQLPTAYFGLILIGDSVGGTAFNLFTGEAFNWEILGWTTYIMEWVDNAVAVDVVATVTGLVTTATADICGVFYNIFWSPFTHMPMFIGLPLGGMFAGLVIPLAIKVASVIVSIVLWFIDVLIPG
jgi:hypothetical protein